MSNYNSARYGRRQVKTLMLVAIMAVANLTIAYAAAADFSGKWAASSPDTNSMGAMYVTLKQTGTTLTGSAGPSESKQFPITTGKVDGDHLTFEIKMGGGTIRFDVTGVASELRGTARVFADDGNTDSTTLVLKRVP